MNIHRRLIAGIVILALSTALAFALDAYGIRPENILLVFVVAVVLINIETRSLLAGLVSGFLCVAIFNYFFTDPRNSFIISDPNYYVSIAIFLSVVGVTNALSTNLQRRKAEAEQGVARNEILNRIGRELLVAASCGDIAAIAARSIAGQLNRATAVFVDDGKTRTTVPPATDMSVHAEPIAWTLLHGVPCGTGQMFFPDAGHYYLPFSTSHPKGVAGVIVLETGRRTLPASELRFAEAVAANCLLAFERELLDDEKERANLRIEKEKFRSALLRSISHDIRTPLTGICAGVAVLKDGFDSFAPEERDRMLADIGGEAMGLSDFVENLLHMTRLDADGMTVGKRRILLDDLFAEVVRRTERRLGTRRLQIDGKEEGMFVLADQQLLIQVFVNLIDNVVRHGRPDAAVTVSSVAADGGIRFAVADDAGGIPADRLGSLFEDYAAAKAAGADRTRGTGLGLPLCKAIVTAHGGWIKAENNAAGGATITFFVPDAGKEEKGDG